MDCVVPEQSRGQLVSAEEGKSLWLIPMSYAAARHGGRRAGISISE